MTYILLFGYLAFASTGTRTHHKLSANDTPVPIQAQPPQVKLGACTLHVPESAQSGEKSQLREIVGFLGAEAHQAPLSSSSFLPSFFVGHHERIRVVEPEVFPLASRPRPGPPFMENCYLVGAVIRRPRTGTFYCGHFDESLENIGGHMYHRSRVQFCNISI